MPIRTSGFAEELLSTLDGKDMNKWYKWAPDRDEVIARYTLQQQRDSIQSIDTLNKILSYFIWENTKKNTLQDWINEPGGNQWIQNLHNRATAPERNKLTELFSTLGLSTDFSRGHLTPSRAPVTPPAPQKAIITEPLRSKDKPQMQSNELSKQIRELENERDDKKSTRDDIVADYNARLQEFRLAESRGNVNLAAALKDKCKILENKAEEFKVSIRNIDEKLRVIRMKVSVSEGRLRNTELPQIDENTDRPSPRKLR